MKTARGRKTPAPWQSGPEVDDYLLMMVTVIVVCVSEPATPPMLA